MVAVMGPSGSGKSTLLYAVSGMDHLTAGEVNFCGRNIAGMVERELADLRLDETGFIFQQMYMLKHLTILDNIILPATQSKKLREPRRETARPGVHAHARHYRHCRQRHQRGFGRPASTGVYLPKHDKQSENDFC